MKKRNEAKKQMEKSKSKFEALKGNTQVKNYADVSHKVPNEFINFNALFKLRNAVEKDNQFFTITDQ